MKGIVLEHCGLKGSPTRVISTYVPTAKKNRYLIENKDGQAAVEELMDRLQKDGVF